MENALIFSMAEKEIKIPQTLIFDSIPKPLSKDSKEDILEVTEGI